MKILGSKLPMGCAWGLCLGAWLGGVSLCSAQSGGGAAGGGDGLLGSYFSNSHLFGAPLTNQVDGAIAFDYTTEAIDNASEEYFLVQGLSSGQESSVRWSGELEALSSELYTLYLQSDDGARIWLNENLLIDDWGSHSNAEVSASLNLTAGQRYLIRVECRHNRNHKGVALSWSSPSMAKAIIPQSQLYSQPTDTDGNGLPDLWELHYFGRTGVDPNADPDGDGLSNLQEYKNHSNPLDPTRNGLPNAWSQGDVDTGSRSDASDGSAGFTNGVFTVTSLGRQIWARVDNFHFVYQPIGTNAELVARLTGLGGINPEAKAGLMLRESLDKNARNVLIGLVQNRQLLFESRNQLEDRTIRNHTMTNQVPPAWFKLVRNGDWVGTYYSTEGTNWTLYDWENLKGMPEQVFVGLSVTAHSHKGTRQPTTASFEEVRLGAASPGDVLSPAIGQGDGLLGSYRNDSLLYLPGLTNVVEKEIDVAWFHAMPFKFINPDSYGVSWSGELQAQFSELYTFSLRGRAQNWLRLWINDQLVIDGWRVVHGDEADFTGSINLEAGQRYLIRVEMYNNDGQGMARLKWQSPSTPKRVIPQSQLFSQPLDSDGNGLPDAWEKLYFGHLGVDPNADPDGDGLSNLQEYEFHTNPTRADTDGDGIPDGWEIGHGLDPQFNDAGLDYDNSGMSNLQKFQSGLDPYNSDANGDGLPDSLEVGCLGLDLKSSHADLASLVAGLKGAQATNLLGGWQVEGTDLVALDRRGGVDYVLSVSNADKYVLNLVGTQNQNNPFESSFKLRLGIDGQDLGFYTLIGGYGTNGLVSLVLPYLQAGSHTVHIFWDGVASYSSLRIKEVKLLSVAGADSDHNGLKDWAEKLMRAESGLDATNGVIESYTSPACVEGRDPYLALARATGSGTNALTLAITTNGHWYANVPLQSQTNTPLALAFQNGGFTQSCSLKWLPVNLLSAPRALVIRKGDSLLFNALPADGSTGTVRVSVGTNTYTGSTAEGVVCQFTQAGTYTASGTFSAASGSSQSGSATVTVVEQSLPAQQPCAWVDMERSWSLTNWAPQAVLQADAGVMAAASATNADGSLQLTLGSTLNQALGVVARLGTNGPILEVTRVQGFELWSGNQAYTKVLEEYPDKSQLIEMLLVSSPLKTNVTFVIEPIVSGVIFEDGTTTKTLRAADFDALGQYAVRFIRPAATHTSVCNAIKAYQGAEQIGYRH